MRFSISYIAVFVMLFGSVSAFGQGRTVVVGLEGHAEYGRLVEREATLARRADSLSQAMSDLRQAFRTDTSSRAANAALILRMEEESFDIRGIMTSLASRINAIEQEWALSNLETGTGEHASGDLGGIGGVGTGGNGGAGGNGGDGGDGNLRDGDRMPANLVFSTYFERNLSPEGLHELLNTQSRERELPRILEDYRANHARMRSLAAEYDRASTQGSLDSIKSTFDGLARLNAELDRLAREEWETIFDNKSYAYNYLMDKANRRDMLARFETGLEAVRAEQLRWEGTSASEALTNYVLQKRMLTGYEIALAGDIGNPAAVDSLRRVEAALPRPDKLGLDAITLKERLLLDYADISIGASPYNSRNPIPAVTVYSRGVIYRVQLGNFSAAQSPTVFRGAQPLALDRSGGRFRYFAGGFPNDSLAGVAVEQMKKAGFRSPRVAVWMDGVFFEPETASSGAGAGSGAAAEEKFYRLEITGSDELPEQAKNIIRETAAGTEIVRTDTGFIVTPISGGKSAQRLRLALDGLSEMSVRVAAISE